MDIEFVDIKLVGDITDEDFEEFFGMPWRKYTAPIRKIASRLKREGQRVDRPWICRENFNKTTLPKEQQGRDPYGYFPETKRDPKSVRMFYGSDFYSRVLAYDPSAFSRSLKKLFAAGEQLVADGPYKDGLTYVCSRFGEQNIRVLDYGHGMARTIAGLMGIASRAELFVVCDIRCKMREFLEVMFTKYVHNVNFQFEHKEYSEKWLVSNYGPYHFVNCTDVLEHCHNPEDEIKRIANVMVDGGILHLGTFFNSCQGEDVTHLEETEIYQDVPLWHGKVYDAGFELHGKDQNGVEKLFRKIAL